MNWRNGSESITVVPLLVTANFFDTLRIRSHTDAVSPPTKPRQGSARILWW